MVTATEGTKIEETHKQQEDKETYVHPIIGIDVPVDDRVTIGPQVRERCRRRVSVGGSHVHRSLSDQHLQRNIDYQVH